MENMEVNRTLEEYKGKRVFVTGHTGFKGSWLIYALHKAGAIITGYSLPPETTPSLFNLIKASMEMTSIEGDINDSARLTKQIASSKPDFIFHLAAQPLVRRSYDDPLYTFSTNVIGTANLLNGLISIDHPCVVVLITTDKVYENKEWNYPYREIDRLGGHDPYSASKACAEIVIESFARSFFDPSKYNRHQKAIASVRAGNVIGGGDWSKDRLLPDIAKSISEDREIIIRNPNSVRPWQHVLEPIFGYLKLGIELAKDPVKFNGAFNFGPESSDSLEVLEVVKTAISSWGQGKLRIDIDPTTPHEAGLLKLDISKANNVLGWKPKMKTSEAIDRTIQWYKSYYNRTSSAEKLMEEDVLYFQQLSRS